MKKTIWVVFVAVVVVGVLFASLAARQSSLKKNRKAVLGNELSLITEPDDGIAPVLAMIRSASSSVDLVMYEFEDRQIESALIADEERGVAVRDFHNECGGVRASFGRRCPCAVVTILFFFDARKITGC